MCFGTLPVFIIVSPCYYSFLSHHLCARLPFSQNMCAGQPGFEAHQFCSLDFPVELFWELWDKVLPPLHLIFIVASRELLLRHRNGCCLLPLLLYFPSSPEESSNGRASPTGAVCSKALVAGRHKRGPILRMVCDPSLSFSRRFMSYHRKNRCQNSLFLAYSGQSRLTLPSTKEAEIEGFVLHLPVYFGKCLRVQAVCFHE